MRRTIIQMPALPGLLFADEAAIKTAAKQYNADYPEAAQEIDEGAAVVYLIAQTPARRQREVLVTLTPGVEGGGGFIGAADPVAITLRRRDGRYGPIETARRALAADLAKVRVPVKEFKVGL